jgi:hypothetical protein
MSTYTPIATQTLTSSASSVTFASIPQGYTDLVMVINARTDRNDQANRPTDLIKVIYNGSSASYYSDTVIGSNESSSPYSYRETNQAFMAVGAVPGAQSNANEFGTNLFNFQSYSNTSTFKTMLARGGNATTVSPGYFQGAMVGLWRGSTGSTFEAITSITLAPYVGPNFVSGSTFALYGIQEGNALATKATGGNIIISSGGYWYHAFTSSGTFIPNETLSCDYLVIAGGGAGGKIYGGGGGAGGFRSATSQTLTAGNYPVIVGAGGAVVNLNFSVAGNGSDSSINSLLSTGGGGGASDQQSGASGGSGGGGGYRETGGGGGGSNAGGAASPVTSPVQGYAGGTGGLYGGFPGVGAGGGGGATAVGGTGGSNSAGNGGTGSNAFSTWASATGTGVSGYYAGGGGGGKDTGSAGSGGAGGGGAGSASGGGTAGTPNTGGGGGGGYNATPPTGNGGSGIVIVRYAV